MMKMNADVPNAYESDERPVLLRAPTKIKAAMVVVGGGIVVATSVLTTLGVLGFFNGRDQRVDNDTVMIPVDFIPDVRAGPISTSSPTPSIIAQSQSSLPSFAPLVNSVPSQSPSSRRVPTYRPSPSPTSTRQPSWMPSSTPSLYPTPIASANPSMQPSGSPTISSAPTQYPTITPSYSPSDIPSSQPSMLPTLSFQPTEYPTVKITSLLSNIVTTNSTNALSKLSFNDATGQVTIPGTFHLRIHWKEGYLWQESPLETWWCMACATCNVNIFEKHCVIEDICRENMMVATVECDPEKWLREAKKGLKPQSPAVFTLLKNEPDIGLFGAVRSGFHGDRIQVHGTNLCLTRVGTRDVFLQPCNSTLNEQLFFGFQSDGTEMELYPFAEKFLRGIAFEPERCLTQHHHPREGERIYSEFCRRARNAEHSMWVTY